VDADVLDRYDNPSRLPLRNIVPLFCVSIDLKKILQRGGDGLAVQDAVIALECDVYVQQKTILKNFTDMGRQLCLTI
jgi:hypothetical protein